MAIDLPPVMPPQLATHQEIVDAGAARPGNALQAEIGGISVRVVGDTLLADEQIRAVLDAADTPCAAITGLTRRYYHAGHLLVSVRYFRSGNTVTVLVSQSAVKGLRGDSRITRHFQDLVGDRDLSLAEFDRARVMADLKAERIGVDYSVSYEQHFDDQVILNFQAQPRDDYRSREFQVEASNRGSRFLGRYFAGAGVSQRFANGTQASLHYQRAFPELGEAGDGEDYHQLALVADHPFSFGLYGLELSELRYERDPYVQVEPGGLLGSLCVLPLFDCAAPGVGGGLEAEVSQIALRGEQVLYSNPVRRINLFERLEHIDSETVLKATGRPLLEEQYQAATVGVRYAGRSAAAGLLSYFRGELALTAGLGGSGGSFQTEDSDEVAVGRRSADFLLFSPRVAYRRDLTDDLRLRANLQAQLSDGDQLPQQQQYVLGGMGTLAAYLPGVLIGDSGYYLNLTLAGTVRWWGLNWEPGIFVEYGASKFTDTGSALGEFQSLADGGLRLKLDLPQGLETELLAATPLYDDVVDEQRRQAMEAEFFWRLRWRY